MFHNLWRPFLRTFEPGFALVLVSKPGRGSFLDSIIRTVSSPFKAKDPLCVIVYEYSIIYEPAAYVIVKIKLVLRAS